MRIYGLIATTVSCRMALGANRRRSRNQVLLTIAENNPNAAEVRFLIEGAPVPADAENYQRVVLLFDGGDEEAVAAARGHWSDAKAKGFAVTYWQSDDRGRWVKKA